MTKLQKKEAERLYILGYSTSEIIAAVSTPENPVSRYAIKGVKTRGRWQEKRNVYIAEIGKPHASIA